MSCRVGVGVFVFDMSLLLLCVTLYLSVFLVDVVDGKSVIAITSPATLKRTITPYTPAVFGNPKYGGYVNGVLFYPSDPKNRLGCFPIDVAKETDLPTGEHVSVIWMLDRSPDIDDPNTPDWNDVCSFVTKVRYAQQAGAVAVVVVNRQKQNENGQLVDDDLVYMADDGSGGDVSSPAVMIQNSAAQPLIVAMRTGTTTKTFHKISMQISWSIPTDDGNVKWDLWTSAYDTESISLKRIFGRADFELHRNTTFSPRYFYYSGENFGGEDCTKAGNSCGNNCVANGKYCQYDPDGEDAASFTGADIVLENLWQSCVWDTLVKASKDSSDGNAHMITNKWWGYVADFQDECNTHESWQTSVCRNRIMDKYGIDKSVVKACYDLCDLQGTRECTMIAKDITDRTVNSGVFYLPTLVVNGEAIRGSISCYSPISTSSCKVMSYICQGYSSSTRPAVCTNSADGCNFWERRDCAGVCAGSSSVDRCGLCLGPDDGSRDRTCRDCNNEIYGNHTLDACGVCLEKTDSTRNSTCKDCLGIVHGTAEKDACGVCQGDGKSCEKSSMSTGAIIAIVLAISGVVGGAIYLYMRRQQNRMRDDIDGILKQYLPLDGSAGGGGGGGGGTGHIRPTQRLDGHDNL